MTGADLGLVAGCLFLIIFSIGFDLLYTQLASKRGYPTGYFVVGGVVVVGGTWGFVTGDWNGLSKLAILFSAAGAWMVIGETRRNLEREQEKARVEEQERMRLIKETEMKLLGGMKNGD